MDGKVVENRGRPPFEAFRPVPYPDELLPSLVARMWRAMGRPHRSTWLREVFGYGALRATHDLPTRIALVAAAFGDEGMFTADAIVDRMTLFNYFAAFVPMSSARSAKQSMIEGGSAPQIILGMNGQSVPPIDHLRFCPQCMREWSAAGEEGRWLRTFQLPSTLVCMTHRLTLRKSTVLAGRSGRMNFETADHRTCPADALPVVNDVDDSMMRRLVELAEAGAILLSRSPLGRDPLEWRTRYREWLARTDPKIELVRFRHGIVEGIEAYWGRCAELWGKAASPRGNGAAKPWPIKLLQSADRSFPPLQHFLVQGYFMDRHLTKRELFVVQRFDDGPWPCENPVAKHYKQLCVTKIERKNRSNRLDRYKGHERARFTCSCGCVYSRYMLPDGTMSKPTIQKFGLVAEKFIEARAADGWAISRIARALHSGSERVFVTVEEMGLDPSARFGWSEPAMLSNYKRRRSLREAVRM